MAFEHNGYVDLKEFHNSGRWEEVQDNTDRILERERAQDNHVRILEAEREEEARKRISAKKAARSEPILKWRDIPEEFFKITEVREIEGKWGKSQILTLKRRGKELKVWACDRVGKEVRELLLTRKLPLWLESNGMKKRKSGHYYFDSEVGG